MSDINTSAEFGEGYAVEIEYVTDFDGREIDPDKEEYPRTLHGPFTTSAGAEEWMNARPDDTDVHDMRVIQFNKVQPESHVEVVILRDSDSDTQAWVFVDGEESTTAAIEIIDNGYSDLSDEDTLTDWISSHDEAAEGFSPAAAERIRSLVESEAEAHRD